MRAKSSTKAAEHRERISMLKRTTHGPERCAWPSGCTEQAVDIDEKLARGQGGSITDRDNLTPLCRRHHDWRHANPAEAVELGLRVRRNGIPITRGATREEIAMIKGVPDTHTPKIAVRLSTGGIAFADELAAETGTTRSDALRALFSVGSAHREEAVERLTSKPTPEVGHGNEGTRTQGRRTTQAQDHEGTARPRPTRRRA